MSLLPEVIIADTRANQPAAAAGNEGYLYVVTDEGNILERSNGSSWVTVGADADTVLDEIGSTQGQVLFRGSSGWEVLAPGTAGNVLRTAGAAADPTWATPSAILDGIGSTQGQVLFRGSAGWETLSPGTDGDVLTTHGGASDPTWETPSGGGGGGGDWSLHDSWTHAGDVANVDFDVTGLTDVLVIFRAVSFSASTVPIVYVSTDSGSTFRSTSGDYLNISATGSGSNSTGFGLATGNNGNGAGILFGINVSGAPKLLYCYNTNLTRYFVQSTDAITDIRAGAGSGNMTAGNIYVYGR